MSQPAGSRIAALTVAQHVARTTRVGDVRQGASLELRR